MSLSEKDKTESIPGFRAYVKLTMMASDSPVELVIAYLKDLLMIAKEVKASMKREKESESNT